MPDIKKLKTENTTSALNEEQLKKYEEHTKIIYKYRDQLSNLKNNELAKLLEANKLEVPSGTNKVSESNFTSFLCERK